MLLRSNACVIILLSNQCFIKPCMFRLIAVNILQRFENLDSRSRRQVLEQKDWKLTLEIKSNEYISVFSLIFPFPLVLCSYKALINSTSISDLYKIYTHSYFLFFQLINYHCSLTWCKPGKPGPWHTRSQNPGTQDLVPPSKFKSGTWDPPKV